jgi:hypothetical protein
MVARPSTSRPAEVDAALAQVAAARSRLGAAATRLLARLGLRRDQLGAELARLERHPSLRHAVTATRRALAANTIPVPPLPHKAVTPPPGGLRV